MIEAINYETAHLAGDAFPAMFRLRYRVFIERENYDVPRDKGMEWDQYDNPRAYYLVNRNGGEEISAVARMIPTTTSYMIKDLWPDLVSPRDLRNNADEWELTRVAINHHLDPVTRRHIAQKLVCSFFEFGTHFHIKSFLLVTPMKIIRDHFIKPGHTIDILGGPAYLGKVPVHAARLHVDCDSLDRARKIYGSHSPILHVHKIEQKKAA